MIFAYMIQLSHHMWDDEHAEPRGWYVDPRYQVKNDVDIKLWDDLVDFLAERKYNMALIDIGDGIKYESHPEISAVDAWDKDFLKSKLDAMRARGIEPIPKLNFSTCHDTWLGQYSRMVSTPAYYKVCADLIAEVAELFDYPRFFHLGLDEETYDHQSRFEIAIIRGKELWWHDAYFLFSECEKHGMRPWMWSDYMWKNKELFLEKMPKSVLQSNWYYYNFKTYPESHAYNTYIKAYEVLADHGYDQIPTCTTWSNQLNTEQTLAYGRDKLSGEHLLGYLTAAWCTTQTQNRYYMLNDAERLYLARKKHYPETL